MRLAKYRQIFNSEFNLEFFKQKKDQCHIGESNRKLTEKKKGERNRTSVQHIKKLSARKKMKRTNKQYFFYICHPGVFY